MSWTTSWLLLSQNESVNSYAVCESFAVNDLSERTVGAVERTFNTNVDRYFQQHGVIPRPKTMHSTLGEEDFGDSRKKGVLVIGDVHGCLDELQRLVAKAVSANDGVEFQQVVLAGDLVNKGPNSCKVIQYVRSQHWLSVRGNHDDGALATAVGDETRRKKSKYQWVMKGDESNCKLTDSDVEWLSELPYTIRIPGHLLGSAEDDVLVVHAGLIPGLPLEEQTVDAMVTMRFVEPQVGKDGVEYLASESRSDSAAQSLWGSVWLGPARVVFGHDARRGLQQHKWATGLDTGACYGGKLTGIILPEGTIVQVDANKDYNKVEA